MSSGDAALKGSVAEGLLLNFHRNQKSTPFFQTSAASPFCTLTTLLVVSKNLVFQRLNKNKGSLETFFSLFTDFYKYVAFKNIGLHCGYIFCLSFSFWFSFQRPSTKPR